MLLPYANQLVLSDAKQCISKHYIVLVGFAKRIENNRKARYDNNINN